MSIDITVMGSECLVVATLRGFSDEALVTELMRRMALARDGGQGSAVHPSLAPINPAMRSAAHSGVHGEEIHEVVSLEDFLTAALADEIASRGKTQAQDSTERLPAAGRADCRSGLLDPTNNTSSAGAQAIQ